LASVLIDLLWVSDQLCLEIYLQFQKN